MQQLTKEQAIALYNSETWKEWDDEEIVKFQLFQNKLCLPFSRFHQAIEKVLNRPVWSHEFAGDAGQQRLIDEFQKERSAPSFQEIIDMIPAEKRIIIQL